jgi:tRNA G26 N,N-dimethylase Trm1
LASSYIREGRLEGSSKNVVLLCEGCGERIVLGGPVWVWNCGSTSFACECGAQLTLSSQLDPSDVEKRAEPLHTRP